MNKSTIQLLQKKYFATFLKGISLYLLCAFIVLFNTSLSAQGNLLIAPHRVVFEGQKRSIEVNLANTGQDSAKYSISFLQYRMTDDGSYEEVTTPDPGQNFADKNIRFFPRTVILGPSESQIVKLQLIKSDELTPGEYRSHLYFRALPNQKALGEEELKKDTSSISIKIIPIFGITIPVIIRVGESTTVSSITDLKLEKTNEGKNNLLLTIRRTGNMSAFGDVSVFHIAPNGKETQIGIYTAFAVYTPNLLRKLQIALEDKPVVDMSKGTIRVLFSSQSDTKPVKLATADLLL